MDTLAAAYARAGKFKDAAGIAQIALSLAKNQNKKELVKKISKRIETYKSGKVYTGPRY
jgi:hypothetical protein